MNQNSKSSKHDPKTMEQYEMLKGTYDFTYFSGTKETPNRVTVLGKNCGDRICFAFARQGNKEVFNGIEGIVQAGRRLSVDRNCIEVPLENGADLLGFFKKWAEKFSNYISPNLNYKKDIKEGELQQLVVGN